MVVDKTAQLSASKIEENDSWYQLNIPETEEDVALEEMEEARVPPIVSLE